MVKKYIPSQGDIVWVSFDPTQGHEQYGYRPAIVISRTEYNARSGMMLCCPITSKSKYHIHIPIKEKITSGFALCDHVRSVDWYARKPKFIENCNPEVFSFIINIITSLIQQNESRD